ncbi:MAG: cysteine desulfurase family protein, partial [Verrucomicrobiales bacterium]|nr:cysteine desulfurase family protein [Verrucomicrobiales bacterium]
MSVYLDNNATTPVDPAALKAMLPYFTEHFHNPSGAYAASKTAAAAVGKARGQVAQLLHCKPSEVVFTSGGTESDITAIDSALNCYRAKNHVVTCSTEHPAVLEPLATRSRFGVEVTTVGVTPGGQIDLDQLRAAVRPGKTALVSVMWANNETGVINPVHEIAEIAASAGAFFHSDAVQAVGKIPTNLPASGIHYASVSAHKLHGPKGIGALFVSEKARFFPALEGGGQESGRRSGTENVPGIVGLGTAAAIAFQHLQDHPTDPVATLRDHLVSSLQTNLTGVHLNGDPAHITPNTASVRFDGCDAAGLLLLLDRAGVACSAGSACHTGSAKPSGILTAMGIPAAGARTTLRLSLSRFTTAADIDLAITAITSSVEKMRSLRPSS